MGQCCSFALQPGRRKIQLDRGQKGSTEGKSTSTTSRSIGFSTLRRSSRRPSNVTEECEAEAASGFFSMSDFSKASGICTSPADGAPTGKEHQSFGRLIAQEALSDAMRKSTDRQMYPVEKPSPSPVSSSKASGDGHGRNYSSGEITGSPSVADSMNIKGRRSLERLRLLAAESPKSLKKIRSRNETSNSGSHNSSLHSRESKQSLSGPVDFDFLMQKAAADYPQKTVAQALRDGERSTPTDLNSSDSAGTSSISGKEMDDLSKSYRESAAKAAARDRDTFKYISSSENDVSITSSVGASPAVRPSRKRHSRCGSSFSVPDGVSESPTHDSGTLMKNGALHKQKAGSSPLPRPVGLIRNKSSPSIPRSGTPPVEAKLLGLTRIRSSPGSLHRAGITAADAQAQARQKYAHAQFVFRAGKLSSSTRVSTQSRRIGTTFTDDDLQNFRS